MDGHMVICCRIVAWDLPMLTQLQKLSGTFAQSEALSLICTSFDLST